MIKNLQDLNLKEVSQRTQIEIDFLNALIEKDFKRLSKFNVKGFCKILTREYDFDFTELLEEYNAFLNENTETPNKEANNANITTKVDIYSQKSSHTWIYLLIIAIIAVLAFVVYKYNLLDNFLVKKNEPINSSVIDIVGQAKDNLNSVLIINSNNDSNSSEETSTNSQTNEEYVSEEEEKEENKEDKKQEENISTNTQTNNTLQDAISNLNNKNEAIFSTKGKVWVGFINMSDGKKTALVTDENFTVDLATNQLILIGATAITLLDGEGKTHEFPAGQSKRFMVKDGKVRNISLTEFMNNNRGREW